MAWNIVIGFIIYYIWDSSVAFRPVFYGVITLTNRKFWTNVMVLLEELNAYSFWRNWAFLNDS
jgi:hypothetical protein